MKHLEFSGEYRELIISGKKRVTIRKRVNLKVGDEVYVHCGGEIIGKAKILEVEKKRVDELTDDDAKLDGFKNKDELIKELKRIYGDSAEFYVVKFEFEPSDAINPHEFYYGDADLEEIAIKALEKLKLSENERKILQVFFREW